MTRQTVPPPPGEPSGDFRRRLYTSSNAKDRALSHTLGREVRVFKVLAYLSMMRSAGIPIHDVTCGAAQRKTHSAEKYPERLGIRFGPEEAAHYLPGQILLYPIPSSVPLRLRTGQIWSGPVRPWELVNDQATSHKIEYLFAEEENLPAHFNDADQSAEENGLCDAFAYSCRQIINDRAPAVGNRINRPLVTHVWRDIWRPLEEKAFRQALEKKLARPGVPPLKVDENRNVLNLRERETASASQWNIEHTIGVLKDYLESWQRIKAEGIDLGYVLSPQKMSELERDFKP